MHGSFSSAALVIPSLEAEAAVSGQRANILQYLHEAVTADQPMREASSKNVK